MSQYEADIATAGELIKSQGSNWNVDPENVARMKAQNRFRTGLDIANYTARLMREDMAAYDADSANYTKSLGCWHGFVAQQKMISVKKYLTTTKSTYLYLSGWMIAALRSEFGPLPDQSMHENTSVPALIEELYTFLRQADARELGGLFRELDAARESGDSVGEKRVQSLIDNFERTKCSETEANRCLDDTIHFSRSCQSLLHKGKSLLGHSKLHFLERSSSFSRGSPVT